MRITFVLPMYLDSPAGGFKVVYEYANRLQRRGHQVAVVHPRNLEPQPAVKERIKSFFWDARLKLKYRPLIPWMDVHPEVRLLLVPDLREEFIPDGDAIFATAYQTAFWVNDYSGKKGKKFYLIQSYEDWNGPEERVRESWLLPLHKIVISQWLMRMAERYGEAQRTDCIPIGLDLARFRITTPIEERTTPRVGMLAHANENKGMRDGIEALEAVRAEIPGLKAAFFGTSPRSPEVPDWIEYGYRLPLERLVELYNSCQVFLNPSWVEGWGLTSAESMACGCALVSAANGGVDEFATDGQSALLAPVKDVNGLARQTLRLLRDENLRRRIARKGNQEIQRFSWDHAVKTLERSLTDQYAAAGIRNRA
jgi:glycosyltransferase involved in cell wall biosynthesis